MFPSTVPLMMPLFWMVPLLVIVPLLVRVTPSFTVRVVFSGTVSVLPDGISKFSCRVWFL